MAGPRMKNISKRELMSLCADLYQIVGHLASEAGVFDRDATEKVLDNLVAASNDKELPHKELLPYIETVRRARELCENGCG